MRSGSRRRSLEMGLVFCCLVLATVPVLSRQPEAFAVTLYTRFEQPVPDAILSTIKSELALALHPGGLHVEWQPLPGPPGAAVANEFAVISFTGRCDVDDLEPGASRPGDLGWTYVSDGVVTRFGVVDCDRIRGFIQSALISVPPLSRPAVFGRAAAHVAAHEAYHILAQTQHHAGCGAGKAAYTVRQLLSPGFGFDQTELRAIRDGCAYPRGEPANDEK